MQPTFAATPPGVAGVPGMPAGTSHMSRAYYDAQGVRRLAHKSVPVDQAGTLIGTEYRCRKCRTQGWFPATLKDAPVCQKCGKRREVVPLKRPPLLPWRPLWGAVERPLRPVWALSAMAAVGYAVDAAPVPSVALLVAAPVAGELARRFAQQQLTRTKTARGRLEEADPEGGKRLRAAIARQARLVGYGTSAGLGWLALAATFGVDPSTMAGRVALGVLGALWTIPAATWWWKLRVERNRPAPPEPQQRKLTADELSAAEAAQIWRDEVNAAGTVLDTARWRKVPCGWEAVVVASKRGALNSLGGDNMRGTIKRIAAAFDVATSSVTWLDEHEGSPNQALLLVQPNNPLAAGQAWGGPRTVDIVKGVAESGRLIDGSVMRETLFTYGWGAPSEIVLGTTGGGKSGRLRKKIIIERWASFVDPQGVRRGTFVTILHDPKRMQSYAEFKRAVHAYGITRDDAHLIVDALLREMFRRYDLLGFGMEWEDAKGRKREGGIAWNPLVHGPIISHYWDEFHELAGDAEFIAKLEKLARYQRACGMRGTLASHMATLGDTGSQALRDMLAGGRATLFRTTSGLNGALVTGGQLTGDPRSLPRQPGMCYVSDGETPTMMGRESYVPSDEEAEKLGARSLYDWLFDDDNNPIGFPAEIPPETAEAFGPDFMAWMEAGKQRGGRLLPPPGSSPPGSQQPDDASAADALLRILFDAPQPMRRREIVEHAQWRWSDSQLGNVLKVARDCRPPSVVRLDRGNGVYELTPMARERIRSQRAELESVAA